jgi:antitoxin HigA-1
VAGVNPNHAARLEERLQALHTAMCIEDMDLPGFRLHPLKVLGRSPESWLLMQNNYDLWQARQEVDLTKYETICFAAYRDTVM